MSTIGRWELAVWAFWVPTTSWACSLSVSIYRFAVRWPISRPIGQQLCLELGHRRAPVACLVGEAAVAPQTLAAARRWPVEQHKDEQEQEARGRGKRKKQKRQEKEAKKCKK